MLMYAICTSDVSLYVYMYLCRMKSRPDSYSFLGDLMLPTLSLTLVWKISETIEMLFNRKRKSKKERRLARRQAEAEAKKQQQQQQQQQPSPLIPPLREERKDISPETESGGETETMAPMGKRRRDADSEVVRDSDQKRGRDRTK